MKWLNMSVLCIACLAVLVIEQHGNLYRGLDISGANFVEHLQTVLDVSAIMSFKAHGTMHCAVKCLREALCFSFNVATTPDVNGLYECQPLATDKYNSSNYLKSSKEFNHYTLLTPCEGIPCQNRGKCRPDYETQNYKCDCDSGFVGIKCQIQVKSCQDLLTLGVTEDGVYTVRPDEKGALKVYCDQTTDGGGWTVLQRRVSPFNTSFDRSWEEYRIGFGNLTREFWLGNDNIHRLAAASVSFRVEFQENGGDELYVKYDNFVVAGAGDKYRWYMDSYSGSLSNAIYGTSHGPHVERGMQFSTPDSDNDGCPGNCNCASRSGWWLNWCGLVDLNDPSAPEWRQAIYSSTYIWASFSEMKVRPR